MKMSEEVDGKQELKLVYKDIWEMTKSLLKDPKFKENLHYESCVERLVLKNRFYCYFCCIFDSFLMCFFRSVPPDHPNFDQAERIYSDMHTGLWLQRAQMLVGNTKTAVGIVLYSDKTHGLQGMKCYPLYSELKIMMKLLNVFTIVC